MKRSPRPQRPQSTTARPSTAQTLQPALPPRSSPSSLWSDPSASLTPAKYQSLLTRSQLLLGTTPAAKGSATPQNAAATHDVAAVAHGTINTPDPLAPTAPQRRDVPTATDPSQPDTVTVLLHHGVRMVGLSNPPKKSLTRSATNATKSPAAPLHLKPCRNHSL
jgi:hypothetical protein